ncbi:hypothetical protein ABXN37_08375 [Piscinibacter sakaiensis]|uniref:hypothetical protein n=1 Tax=Piscinibacter sakaiensis TaxID=1547922 RepID=UPI003728BBED
MTLQPYDGGLVLVDTATGRLRFIERPAVPEANVLTRVALRVADGVPELLFSLAPSLTREPTLFRWRADSGTASVFSPGWQPVTDGRRLAWTRAPLAIASWNPGTLVTAPADGSQPAVEYPLHEIGNYVLADGVLAWQALGRERSLPGPVQVSVAHGDTPQAIDGSILLHVAGGWVYLTTGRAAIEAYDPATRTLRIVARERPDQWLVDGGVVLLRYGRAVLRVAD